MLRFLTLLVVVNGADLAHDCLSADGALARTGLESAACHFEQQEEDEVERQEDADAEAMSVELLQMQVDMGRRKVLPAAIHPQASSREAPAVAAMPAVVATASARRLAGDQSPVVAAPATRVVEEDLHPSAAVPSHATGVAEEAETLTLVDSRLEGHGHHHSKVQAMMKAGPSVIALVLGALLMVGGQRTVGMLVVYFGMQSGFSLYMKLVLSDAYISQELNLKGIPAAFFVTAIQQVVAFLVICFVIAASSCTRWRYRPKRLTTVREWAGIFVFSLAFGLNIGLNNFSLSLVAVSLNLIVRSCVPLATLVLQLLTGLTGGRVRATEVFLMVLGVAFAVLATMAKEEGSKKSGSEESKHLLLGVFMCSLSDVAAALNLVLAAWFGAYVNLNAVDTTLYMAVPAGLTLVPTVFLCAHPVEWPGYGPITDWSILRKVLEINPDVLGLVFLSGVFAAGYNLLQYSLVQRLSAAHAAFAGNFNKAATIMISICMGFETLPGGMWSAVMLFAIVGNILSFTGYSVLKVSEKKEAAAKEADGDGVPASSIATPQTKAGA